MLLQRPAVRFGCRSLNLGQDRDCSLKAKVCGWQLSSPPSTKPYFHTDKPFVIATMGVRDYQDRRDYTKYGMRFQEDTHPKVQGLSEVRFKGRPHQFR